MSKEFAQSSYGTKIPGLSVHARAKGADWLYTYLRTFYTEKCVEDDGKSTCSSMSNRPTGMNNAAFADVGMPHVLWKLQGEQKANFIVKKKMMALRKKYSREWRLLSQVL